MTFRLICRTLLGLALLTIVQSDSRAQLRGTTGAQPTQFGAVGATPFGGTTGQSTFGRTTGAASPFGQRTGGFGQNTGFGTQRAGLGQSQFGGQDFFVGSDAQQLRNQQAARNAALQRAGQFNFNIENLNQQRNAQQRGQGGQNQKPPVRVKLRPLFDVPTITSAELSAGVQSRVADSLPERFDSSAEISMAGGVATVSGSVASEYDKKLLAKMLAIQPGVMQVDNQLTVESAQEALQLGPAQ